jgi:hypothetical protein
MKKYIKHMVLLGGLAFIHTGCNDNFVNTQPLDQVSESAVWTDPVLSERFVVNIYTWFGQGGFDEQMLASLSDEAMFTHTGRGITTITESRSNPADIGWVNYTHEWGNMYRGVRAANIAIKNLSEPQFTSSGNLVNKLMGEAKFMRAFLYHQLIRFYGAVPIVDRPYELGEADYELPRNTMEECINFIVKDLDDAASLLTGISVEKGRATATAALALKSRVLTYAASDLLDLNTAKGKSTALAVYANPEYLTLSTGSRTERWQKAKAAAKAVLDITAHQYKLDLAAPATADEGRQNFKNIAYSRNGGEAEMILGRYFTNLKGEAGGDIGLYNGPNGYHNWAGNTPLQQFVDAFEMADGTKFSWSNAIHAGAPYKNRDPRFYSSVLYDGADWKTRTADVLAKDPASQIQTGQYEVSGAGGTKVAYNGLDTRLSSVEDWNGTRTGYYMRKFLDDNPAFEHQNTRQEIPWPILRYTEAVLNYVEACIELGEEAEARSWLNKIRFRAGMPAITDTGNALRERYRNERLIELSFEAHRYHDIRRWMIAPTTVGAKIKFISIKGTLKPGKTVSIYKYDTDNYDYTYTVQEIGSIEDRRWLDKMYFLPIHRDEMNRNLKLKQNPGYEQ